jgi:hypothetical protein
MKTSHHIIIYLILIGIIVLLRECQVNKVPCPELKTNSTITRHIDTIQLKADTVFYPQPYAVVKGDTFYKDRLVDTAKIIADFSSIRKYRLPVMNDTNGVVDVLADVQFNKITKWILDAKFYPHTYIIEKNHVLIIEPREKLFIGGYLCGNGKNYFGAVPALLFTSKKDHSYFAGFDPLNKTAALGMFFKIRFKK